MASDKRAKKVEHKRKRRKNDTTADWGGSDANLLRSVVEAITKDGGAVRFGYSRDGGAYAIGIYGDGEPYTEYFPGPGDVNEWLEGFRLDYE